MAFGAITPPKALRERRYLYIELWIDLGERERKDGQKGRLYRAEKNLRPWHYMDKWQELTIPVQTEI